MLDTMTGDNNGDRYMEVQGIGDINAEGLSDFAIMACKYLRIFSGNNLKIASEIILEKN